MGFKQLTAKDVKPLRNKLHTEQFEICPVCKQKVGFDNIALDHQHMTSYETIGENGAGLIRGVLCKQCNSWEGKTSNAFKRYGLRNKGVTLPFVLRNLADYLSNPAFEFIHPTEQPKIPKVSKRNYNILSKLYAQENRRKKFPSYPKSKKLTQELGKLFCEFNIEPYN